MSQAGLDANFWLALCRSGLVGLLVGSLSLAVGWPLGVRLGLTDFPLRQLCLALLALPLLVPSFLVAIGLSMLWPGLGGLTGVIWAFASLGIPLVSLATMSATCSITGSQVDAASLAGGRSHVYALALQSTFPLAALAATLVAALTLADAGPGQIFGWAAVSNELLISFAARYDRGLATHQALWLAGVAALLTWPLAWKLAPEIAASLFARDVNVPRRVSDRTSQAWSIAVVTLCALLPLAGLCKPLFGGQSWPVLRAWAEVSRTGKDTLVYAATAAVIAVGVAFPMAWLAGRSPARRRWLVTGALALLALPPALPAIWLIPWSGMWTLGAALALRGLPLAIVLALRAVGSTPPSWADAARVHRVPAATFLVRVQLPWWARWALPAAAISALLATAEVGTVLLLHPPGHASLPLALFTVMSNAPESLVAMLCLLYAALALAVAATALAAARRL
ncbi:MAG: hypothetical protein AMXMBFR33_20510 [Candidatus Xenobia bacterium]